MNSIYSAIAGILFLFLLMSIRVPVGFAMLFTGFLGFSIVVSSRAAFALVSSDVWLFFSSYSISAVPMFVLMGQIAYHSGITEKLYNVAYKWIGHLKGGMAATTIAACALFSTVCGSNVATIATMGTIALPQMKKYGYDSKLSTGSVAVGGTLGIMIPPSIGLIMVALLTGQSITRLFVAVLLPGFLLSGLLIATVFLVCKIYPEMAPAGPKKSFKEKIISLPGALETILLFILVVGGLYMGWFTPTEAGAAGSFGMLTITLLQKKLSWQKFVLSIFETLQITAMVVIFISGAIIFGRFLSVTRMPFVLATWVAELPVPPTVIMIAIIIIYLVGGALMDAGGFLLLSLPIFYPLAVSLGYDPVWFLILLTLLTTMGSITPPVGINMFVVKGLVPEVSMQTIFKGILIFIGAYLVCIILLMIFPNIVLFLPNLLL